jgi:hypothetical protein
MRKEDWIEIAIQVAIVMGLCIYLAIDTYFFNLKMAELGL